MTLVDVLGRVTHSDPLPDAVAVAVPVLASIFSSGFPLVVDK